jgi:class 3 adenylate cyclase/tetratricopeptide (TPR) repeat protein
VTKLTETESVLRAEAARRNQAQMLARVSHELRMPLSAILGPAQLHETDATLGPGHLRWARHFVGAGRHLVDLVDEVLGLTAPESGRIEIRLVALESNAVQGGRRADGGQPARRKPAWRGQPLHRVVAESDGGAARLSWRRRRRCACVGRLTGPCGQQQAADLAVGTATARITRHRLDHQSTQGASGQDCMHDRTIDDLRAAIAALEGQRPTLGDAVVDVAVTPLRARLAALQRPAGLQHRQVSVLFADVVGSTAMASALDAEDTLAVLDASMRRMAAVIEAHQGRVLRFTGDGVKAAFGMDGAREDDAARAVRAGLAIVQAGREQADVARRTLGIEDFAVRVGVHTGDVALGAGIDADNTAMGAAVNIAARMEQSALPGSLRISHDTWSLVRGLFDLVPQPPLLVKGVDTPMSTYLVRGALDRSLASVERGLQGLSTPLVGRSLELQRLLQAVGAVHQTRQLQAVSLMGDAGLGKSRLLREWRAALAGIAAPCRVLAVRAQPDGLLRPWGLLRSLLAVQFGVADTDSADVARRKIVDGLSPWFDERADHQAQLIAQLSGLDFEGQAQVRGLDPRALRDQAFTAFRSYLQALATRGGAQPVPVLVLVVEDLHWADDSSLDLLQHLLAHAASLPLALVMTSRPALRERRPDWGTPGSVLLLEPLGAAHARELVQALLQRLEQVPPRLGTLIIGDAEGNPYYMEELVRRLIDDGVIVVGEPHWTLRAERLDSLRLPGTLVGLLQARLDALPSAERQAARQASVIGHVFWDDALQALDGKATQALPALQRAAFVKDHDTSDFEGTTERQFDHHLLHQVTYDTLLKSERRGGHAAVARWLSAHTQGRGPEFLAMTGEHAERAGDTAWAITCFEQAGREAQKRFANTAAEAWLRRAWLLLGDTQPARQLDLLSRLEGIFDTLGDRSRQEAVHQDIAALLQRHPDERGQALLWWFQALLADRRSDPVTAEMHCRQSCALAERSGAAHTAARARGLLGWLHLSRGDCPGARGHVDAALPWAGRIEDDEVRPVAEAQVLTISAMVSVELCRFDEARAAFTAVLARGEAVPSMRLQSAALDNLARVAVLLGRWEEVMAWSRRMQALGDACGVPRDVARALSRLGSAAWATGDVVHARACFERCLLLFRSIGDRHMESETLCSLGHLNLERGDAAGAWTFFAQALALQASVMDPLQNCAAAASAALCQAQRGQAEAALSAVDEVLGRLSNELAAQAAALTITIRWTCLQALHVLDARAAAGGQEDVRAAPLLQQLFADVQARAAEMTEASDRERLIQALPPFRDIVNACRRRGMAQH